MAVSIPRPGGKAHARILTALPEIVRVIQEGNTRRVACEVCGIPEDVLSDWMGKGEKIKTVRNVYRVLYLAVLKAEAEAERAALGVIHDAMKSDDLDLAAKYAAWWATRRRPQDWGRRDNIQITGSGGGPVAVDVARESLRKALDKLTPAPAAPAPTPEDHAREAVAAAVEAAARAGLTPEGEGGE